MYFDPPYAPLSRTANFTSYTAGGFNIRAQQQLQRLVVDLARQGCKVLLSNSTAPEISKLYECNRDARAEGLRATGYLQRGLLTRTPQLAVQLTST